MPTYEYACTACGHRLEAVQKFTDDALTVCPDCSGELRKVYAPVGIVLKGSGFYKTDSRANANGHGNGNGKKASESSDAPSSGSSSESSSTDSAKSTSSDSAAKPSTSSTSESAKPAATAAS